MNKILLALVGSLMLLSLAHADIVVIGNPAAPTLSKDQIEDLFLGKSTAMKPVDQSSASPIEAQFYQKLSGHDLAQVKATWSRLVFTGKAQQPKELPDAVAVKKAVAADPKAIGYFEKSEIDSTVKVLLALN